MMNFKQSSIDVPKWVLSVLNNLYEASAKLSIHGDNARIERNIDRILESFSTELNLVIDDPLGQKYDETRTDLDATITGDSTDDLVVTEVIKPVIRASVGAVSKVVQKGIVIVESKNKD